MAARCDQPYDQAEAQLERYARNSKLRRALAASSGSKVGCVCTVRRQNGLKRAIERRIDKLEHLEANQVTHACGRTSAL